MSMEVENHVIEWLPAYVLDALTDDEMSQVAEHLAVCPTCQAELAGIQQVADELPLALAQTAPPPELKVRLMSAIHTRQVNLSTPSQPTSLGQRLGGLLRMRLPALGLALVVVMALGNLLLWRQINQANRQTSTPMRVYALANTQNSPGAVGTLVMDPNGKYGTLVVDNLATLAPGQQYQVWLIKGGERTSGGVFSVNPDGYASLEILAALPLVQYDSIGITIEPAGGSPGPTGAKVLGGELPH
jgi:anti-sigma-K factor RskA